MPIDQEKYFKPAVKADVGTVAINTTIALNRICDTFELIRAGQPVTEELIAQIRKCSTAIEKHFDDLSGWTDE